MSNLIYDDVMMKSQEIFIIKLLFLGFSCLTLLSCRGLSSNVDNLNISARSQKSTNECSEIPGRLDPEKVTVLSFREPTITASGTLDKNNDLGYAFQGNAGERFEYQATDEICAWVYTPENKILTSKILPVSGKYIVQIATLERSIPFELEMSLLDESISQVIPNYSVEFDISNFPKSSCGDLLPTNPEEYPIQFYPVNIPYSEVNLSKVKSMFCRDAFQKTSKDTGEKIIQVVSFSSLQKARSFASFLEIEFTGVQVGYPTLIEQPSNKE